MTEQEIKAQRARFLNNEIQELYWINLVTCPKCWMIHNSSNFDYKKNNEMEYKLFIDCRCWLGFFHHEAPDLFY